MFFKQFYDEGLAQASYLIGCQAQGTAVVVDARRDIAAYEREAERNGLTITAVTETHIHADYLSGSSELARATGATLYLSAEGGPDWQYAFPHQPLRHGDEIRLGNVTLRALHTPGHTPEHLSFLVTDGATASEPSILLSGDFVFVGDIGRPDLLDEAAGYQDSRFAGARSLFASLRDHFLTLPDYLQVWPGHGAGSACGKALGAVPSSTVGYERRYAWWAGYLESGDEAGFTRALLEGQPDAPSYFGRMKRQNRSGAALLGARPDLPQLAPGALAAALEGGALLVDSRSREQYAAGAAPGSLSLPAGKNFSTWAGWLLDPEGDDRPIVLLAAGQEQANALRDELARVGIDNVAAYASSLDGIPLAVPAQLDAAASGALPAAYYLDVRTRSEHEAGHLPGARHIHAGKLARHLGELPEDRPIVVYCQSGARSAAAASFLRGRGFSKVLDLEGGYDAWAAGRRAQVPA